VSLVHSASVRHAWHAPLVVLQYGVLGKREQSALAVQALHVPVVVQTGAVVVQFVRFAVSHWTQAPLFASPAVSQRFGAVQSAPDEQPWHMCVVALQMGVVPPQFALVRHWTQVSKVELPGVVSQIEVAPVHAPVCPAAHCTHESNLALDGFVSQSAVVPVHCDVLPLAQAAHTGLAATVLQTGVAPLQLALATHATHVFVVVSHLGVAPEQAESSTHATHWAVLGLHAGLPATPAQSVFDPQPHCLAERLQWGVVPLQSRSLSHPGHAHSYCT
jgi:hypothetical protein